jgi:cellobiose phosphorylase
MALINPVNHGRSAEEVARYKVEPYVVAADVYARRRTSGAAAGAGTPVRPAGCTG